MEPLDERLIIQSGGIIYLPISLRANGLNNVFGAPYETPIKMPASNICAS